MNLPEFLTHFQNVTRSGNGRYMASCPMPNHSDSDPSVAITQDVDTGNILLYCWGCNTKGRELVAAIGLPMSALFGDPGHSSAISLASQHIEEAPPEAIESLTNYVRSTNDNLHFAKDYIFDRFNLSVERGIELGLGVDHGDNSLDRPQSCSAFFCGAPYLIVPFKHPDGRIVAMQGRRLVDGDPRWRSVAGGGWAKMGCFNWEADGPVIITEGPSDALAVTGRANLAAIAIRGASNTSADVCEQLIEWVGDRRALIVGDSGDAGEKFAHTLFEGTGFPFWIPEEGDLCEFLQNGGSLSDILGLAASAPEPEPVETPQEQSTRLQAAIEADLDLAVYNDALKHELNELPTWQLDAIFNNVIANAGYGQRTMVRQRVNALQRAIRDLELQNQVPGGHGVGGAGAGGGGVHAPIPDDFDPAGLPEIIWNPEDQLHVTNHSIREAMNAYDRGEYYRSASGQYVKVVSDDLVPLKESGVKSMLSEMAHWRIINGQRETGHVPPDAARIITDPSWQSGLSEIQRRVEVPFMLADGNIVSSVGFHEESGVYLLPRNNDVIIVPEVPAVVTDEHVAMAKQIFEDVTEGFMFKDTASKTNLIGMTLTSPLRELFRRNPMVPLLTSTAPQSGSGKGTSIRVPLSTCGVGPHSLGTTAYNPDDNEFEKKLVGKLLKKSTYIFLDNIRANVNSSVLEQMLTAANYDGRTLGYSEVNSLSTLVLWCSTLQSTGTFNRDLTRRCVPVELVKNYRGKWKHKNIEAYLADKRGEMIWACFVVARKWLQDGAPISNVRLDGYGGWTEVIGGMLEHVLGYEAFLDNIEGFRKTQDENGMTIDGVLERWLLIYGDSAQPARMAIEDYEDPALHQMLGLHNPSTRQTLNSLTRLLDQQRGYIVNNTHIWEPQGPMQYGHEGILKLYRCVPLPEDDE